MKRYRAKNGPDGVPRVWDTSGDLPRTLATTSSLDDAEMIVRALDSEGVSTVEQVIADMERAFALAERDPHRPVTKYDAAEWASQLRVAIGGQSAALPLPSSLAPKETP